jgi:hypothetical protein
MLQSPVVRFRNPKTGRSVTIVATMHIGTAAYYDQLRAMINEMESAGAIVCFESPRPTTKQEWAAASDEERAAWDGERLGRREFNKAAGRYLGWVNQSAALGNDAARRIDDARVEERNRHALASLPPGSDAVLPWGGAHLRGLAAGLRKAGYRRRATTWVTVGKLPAFWPCVEAMWAGGRALYAAPRARGDNPPPSSRPDSPA